jgi:uncharacterized protein YndB with AHSA1/START domain
MTRRTSPKLALVLCALVPCALLGSRVRGEDQAKEAKDRTACETVIAASVADAWKAYTTKEGLEAWCVAHAEIDVRIGGLMRTHYDPAGKLGDEKTIENEILSFDPGRMLSIKVKKTPAGFPFPKAIKSMWTVLYFEDAGEGKTRVTCRSFGFGADEESQKMRSFFEGGNAHTLAQLKKHLTAKK